MCMTNEKMTEMNGRLTDELEQNMDRLHELQGELKYTQESDPDPLDVAQKMGQRDTILAESKRLNNRNVQIRKAQNLMREGDYGFCVGCGEEIAPKRMEFDPASIECIDCKTLSESNGRQFIRAGV